MEMSPWSRPVLDGMQQGRLFGVSVEIIGADTGDEFLDQSRGVTRYPSVQHFSRFLYHLGLVYEVSRLALDPQYRRFRFPRLRFRPTISRLKPFDQMVMVRINQNSPWQLSSAFIFSAFIFEVGAIAAGALSGLWLFVQSLEKLSTVPLNRRKLRAEIEKIELESAKLRNEMSPPLIAAQRVERTESSAAPGSSKTTRKRTIADSENLILPPAESSRLFNLLRKRGAKKFYDENTQAARNLGFKVDEMNLQIDDGTKPKNRLF